MTPSSGGIIREIGWKCKAAGPGGDGAVSVCPNVRLNFSRKSALRTCLYACREPRFGWLGTWGARWPLPQGAAERRWPGLAGAGGA